MNFVGVDMRLSSQAAVRELVEEEFLVTSGRSGRDQTIARAR